MMRRTKNIEGEWKGFKSLALSTEEKEWELVRSDGRRRGREAVYKSLSP